MFEEHTTLAKNVAVKVETTLKEYNCDRGFTLAVMVEWGTIGYMLFSSTVRVLF